MTLSARMLQNHSIIISKWFCSFRGTDGNVKSLPMQAMDAEK
jgi:hypothetical protein